MLKPLERHREDEWMDQPGVPEADLRDALKYIRRINHFLGYNRATRQRLEHWSKSWKPGQTVTVLDVATGSADVPTDLLAWARSRQVNLKVIGLDFHPATAREAHRTGIPVLQADALLLPFPDGAFDYVLTSMFLHHLSEEQATRVLSEMWRVCSRGVLAADLLRTRGALLGVWALTRLSSPMIRHDAVVSVRQAFTGDEIERLCAAAGWQNTDLRRHRNHRFTVVANKGPES